MHKVFVVLLLAFAMVIAGNNLSLAGQWTWSETNGTNHTVIGDSAALGLRMAKEDYYATYANPPAPSCKIGINGSNELSSANCHGYSASVLCNTTAPGPWPCDGEAGLACTLPEKRVGDGCCNPNTLKCHPIVVQCTAKTDNPIDLLTGQKLGSIIDYQTAGPNPLAFERFYRSNIKYSAVRSKPYGDTNASDNRPDNDTSHTRFGRAWRSSFDTFLVKAPGPYTISNPTSNSRVNFISADGFEMAFIYSTSLSKWQPSFLSTIGIWTAGRTDFDIKMTSIATGAEVKLKNDITYVFNNNGDLTSIKWPSGYVQTLTYDPDGNNTQVTDNLGRTLVFAFDNANLMTSMTTPEGKVYRYDYVPLEYAGSNSNVYASVTREQVLSHVYYPDATPGVPADDPKMTYHYENATFKHALTGITDERGIRFSTYAYDSEGRANSETLANSAESVTIVYDDANNKVTVTNSLTKQTVFNFVKIQDHRRITSVQGLASADCAAANTTYAYDGNGFKNSAIDAENRKTTYVNNTRGLPTTINEAVATTEARTSTLTWHATLNKPTQIVAPRLTTGITYDAAGNIDTMTQTDTTTHTVPYSTNGQARVWDYNFSAQGLLSSVNGPLAGTGDTVTYAYTANGFVDTITDEVGLVTTVLTRNTSGQPLTVNDPNGVVTTLTYDERNRLKTSTVASAVTTITYDLAGNVTRITRGDGSYLNYTYDDAKRVTLIENNTAEKIELVYNTNGDVTSRQIKTAGNVIAFQLTQTFDELGRLLRSFGAANQTTLHQYDKTDLLKTVTDPRSVVFSYAYDALLRLKSETGNTSVTVNYARDAQDNLATYTDPRSLATAYVRNGFGEVIQEASPDSGTTVYVRNTLGDATQMTDGRSVVTNYTYDNAGRMLTKTFPAATAENITYTWDSVAGGNNGKGRLTSVSDQSGSTAWVYDARGNVTSETRVIEGKSYTTAYAYDLGDNVTQITYASGRIVTIARNALGQVSGITTKKDAGSSAVNVATGVAWRPMSGLLGGFAYGNGLTFAAAYDLDYRISTLKVQDGAANVISLAYAYADGANAVANDGINLTGITDTVTAANNVSLWYTGLGRLQNGNGPWGTKTFSYDAVGNITQDVSVSGATTTRVLAYPATNNKVSTETTNGTVTRNFSYDGAGNRLTGLPIGATYATTYNKRNRPSGLTLNAAVAATYLFNAEEQLASRTLLSPLTPQGTTHYIYDLDGHLIAEAFGTTAATAVITREYIWLDGMPGAVVDGVNTASPVTSYVHTDHLARPIKMTSAAKASVWDATWTPWGTAHTLTGSALQNLRFPGQYFLIEQGLHYNWHRFYDPTTGRYTQPDPLGFVDGPSLYAYVKNSPLMYADPTGGTSTNGTPNSSKWVTDRTLRVYGIDGSAVFDVDCPGHHGFLEIHTWSGEDRSKAMIVIPYSK